MKGAGFRLKILAAAERLIRTRRLSFASSLQPTVLSHSSRRTNRLSLDQMDQAVQAPAFRRSHKWRNSRMESAVFPATPAPLHRAT